MKVSTAVVVAVLAVCVLSAKSIADDGDGSVQGGTTIGGLWVENVTRNPNSQRSGGSAGHPDAASQPAAPMVGSAICTAAEHVGGSIVSVTFCGSPGATPDTPIPTLADIRHAFAELPLPAAPLVIQPPDGVTLVNFDTNFYTPSPHPLTRTVTLLGQQVTIRATPASYTWTYGDGASATTSDPGAPYPDLRVTHRYAREGAFRPRLATTYEGAYRLGAAGPWRPIPGTVTIAGALHRLRAVEATPVLVGY